MRNIPIFSLRLAAQTYGDRGRRMHLQTQPVAAIQPFDQNRERPGGRPLRSHDLGAAAPDELPQCPARPLASVQDRLGLGAVDNLPALADRAAGRQRAAQVFFQSTAAPHPLLVERRKMKEKCH